MTETITLEFREEDGSRVISYGVTVDARRDSSTGAWQFVDGRFEYVEMDLSVLRLDEGDDGVTCIYITRTKVVLPIDALPESDRWKVERFIKRKWWDEFREAFEKEWEKRCAS